MSKQEATTPICSARSKATSSRSSWQITWEPSYCSASLSPASSTPWHSTHGIASLACKQVSRPLSFLQHLLTIFIQAIQFSRRSASPDSLKPPTIANTISLFSPSPHTAWARSSSTSSTVTQQTSIPCPPPVVVGSSSHPLAYKQS
jgi:hypothetical protein